MPEVVYLNGVYTDPANAMISVNDRGFVFGDGVYEVIRIYKGALFAMQPHIDRLFQSLEGVEIVVPWSKEDVAAICQEVLQRSELTDGTIYIEVTRGVAARAHLYPTDAKPTLFMNAKPAKSNAELREKGVTAVTVADERWSHCNWKTINLLANIMGKQKAHRAGAWEGIFVRENGIVTEGTSTNLFCLAGGVLLTHPADNRILHGVTRRLVLDLAEQIGVKVKEEKFSEDVLMTADEIFVCGTTTEIMPIVKLNDKVISGGKPGQVTKAIAAAYAAMIG